MFTPSTLNCTPTTPTSSAAQAESDTTPETVAPGEGAFIVIVGGVMSVGGGGGVPMKIFTPDGAHGPPEL